MFNIFNYQYLTHQQLRGFNNYVYNSKDTSPLSNYVMHPFWNVVVKLVPIWIAPNVLTFVGFLMTVFNGVLLTIYDPQFYASSDSFPDYSPIPKWVWIVCAVFHFLAHTLDGVDGKQARRTKSSGPLGELMDHGMDSWTSMFIPFCIYSIFGRADYSQSPLHMHFIFLSIYVTFYLSHWEKYSTGILYLPWSYDATQIALFVLYIVTFVHGHSFWKFVIFGLNSGQIFEFLSYITCFLFSIPMAFYNVFTCQQPKQPNCWESFRPLVSMIFLFLFSTFWAVLSPNNILEAEPRTFYLMVGTLFSNISCRLIVSQMSSTRCQLMNWLLYPLMISTIGSLSWNLKHHELNLLRLNALLLTVFHIHYGICLVRQMCHHLRIYCFSLEKPEYKSPEQENLGKNQ
ncbi:Ethanolaminephosphotransferase 1 [Sarcoptes scabiei]|uniref:Ethanolaminephosphotransferase 1 n=1 Tax=Sarcoptes scabiei TaxID=52283 RepID=A0A834VAN3_SARSC|nr:Ethanolaminephosphotransferase 1 [Sarcoptes scabiei]